MRVRLIRRGHIKALLMELLTKKTTEHRSRRNRSKPEGAEARAPERVALAPNTVRIVHATLRAMLNSALDDGLILSNPADRLGRSLRLSVPRHEKDDQAKAMSRPEFRRFLDAIRAQTPGHYPLVFTLARTGMRLGEAFALTWDRVDLDAREARISKTYSSGRFGSPKSGKARTVDLSAALCDMLRDLDDAANRGQGPDGPARRGHS